MPSKTSELTPHTLWSRRIPVLDDREAGRLGDVANRHSGGREFHPENVAGRDGGYNERCGESTR